MLFAREIVYSVASVVFAYCVTWFWRHTLIYNLATMCACIWTNINDLVCSIHNVFVVLNYYNRVAKSLQLFKNLDESE